MLKEIITKEEKNLFRFSNRLQDAIHETTEGFYQYEATAIAWAYTLYKVQQLHEDYLLDSLTVLEVISNNDKIRLFLEKKICNKWLELQALYGCFENSTILAFILSFVSNERQYEMTTPDSLNELSIRLLEIEAIDNVVDFGAGTGSFLVKAYLEQEDAMYTGVEINTDAAAVASIKAELLGENVRIEQNDMFSYVKEGIRYTKAFSNYPFGMRIKDLRDGTAHLERMSAKFPDITKAKSSDWIFNSLLISSITGDGKAIGIMTPGSTWNGLDRPIREFFIRKGFINTVISLPERMFSGTAIQTVLVVLSHGNKSIRLVDAKDICQKGRRQNYFSADDIAKIIDAVNNDTGISQSISIEELAKNDFVINPARYFDTPAEIKGGVEFGSVIKGITRGAPLKASELDEMTSLEATNYQYLMLSNIRDGFIDAELPYLKTIEQRLDKYCIKKGSLLLSKNGAPFKVAIADCCAGQKILANGNLYLIELDESRIRPYYLKAFFESEQGIISLNSIAVGAAMPNISVEQLKRLTIPLPDLETQRIIEEKYLARVDEVLLLKHKLTKAMSALKNVFEEG